MKLIESETFELKKSTSELKEAVISIVAILNKHTTGNLVFGVGNNGKVIGQDVTEKTLRDISKTISDHIEPKIYPRIEKKEIGGKTCIEVEFQGVEIPYYAYGRAYKRVADEDKLMSAKELEKMILEKNKGKLRWDNKISDKNLDDINEDELKEYISKANTAERINFKYVDKISTLKKLEILKNGQLLNAAEVLFCDDNPLEVQLAIFAGIDKTTFIDIKQIKGNIFKLLKNSETYIKEHINWRVKFGKLEREEIPEIPIGAIREALVNSLCHRDYFAPESNKIAIFKDRVEIYNPGQFPAGFTPEYFINHEEESVLRNPGIAQILYYSKDIEKWGSGLKRIYDECKANKVNVEFKAILSGFKVVFYREKTGRKTDENPLLNYPETTQKLPRNYPETVDTIKENKDVPKKELGVKLGEKLGVKLGENEAEILRKIVENNLITSVELSKKIGISKTAIENNIAKLKKKGLLKRVGPDKGGHWEILRL